MIPGGIDMFNKIVDAFMEKTSEYMDHCAKNSIYNVYVDLVRDQMEDLR